MAAISHAFSLPRVADDAQRQVCKVGAKIVRHGRYVTFQMVEVAIPRDLFADILRRINRLRPKLTPA